jgi:hypothetical protein
MSSQPVTQEDNAHPTQGLVEPSMARNVVEETSMDLMTSPRHLYARHTLSRQTRERVGKGGDRKRTGVNDRNQEQNAASEARQAQTGRISDPTEPNQTDEWPSDATSTKTSSRTKAVLNRSSQVCQGKIRRRETEQRMGQGQGKPMHPSYYILSSSTTPRRPGTARSTKVLP